jgi:hypothetical protein
VLLTIDAGTGGAAVGGRRAEQIIEALDRPLKVDIVLPERVIGVKN